MFNKNIEEIKIAVIGLGYVGLPVAVAFARKFKNTVGFDLSKNRIDTLNSGIDKNSDIDSAELKKSTIKYTTNEEDLRGCNFFVVAVPTPIDTDKRPDLSPLKSASEIVGRAVCPGSIVVYESTVYPGVTEEFCGPIIEKISGLKQSKEFKLGYSPERINPGDKTHVLEKIIKVVSGEDEDTSKIVELVYSRIIDAGVHLASSIKVAEAAKVIENTQRDLNIALMNELAIIFDKLKIPTNDVLEAAGTKWNFLPFKPGLVGGHCIGVDPYYLTTKAEQLGYRPRVILAGRTINDSMGAYIANKLVKMLVHKGVQGREAKVGILGLTFKENVSDLRNSRVPDIITELKEFEIEPLVCDVYADPHEAMEEYGIELVEFSKLKDLDAVIFAVSHDKFITMGEDNICKLLKVGSGVLIDVKGVVDTNKISKNISYWSL